MALREQHGERFSHLYTPLVGSSTNAVEAIFDNFSAEQTNSILQAKVLGKNFLLDNPDTKKLTKKKKAVQKTFQRPGAISCQLKFSDFVGFHRLWTDYFAGLVAASAASDLPNVIIKADFHGALLKVVKSRSVSTVNISGIVIRETINVFHLLTADDRLLVVPKKATVFRLRCKDVDALLYGDQIRQHPGFRAAKKFKTKPSIET